MSPALLTLVVAPLAVLAVAMPADPAAAQSFWPSAMNTDFRSFQRERPRRPAPERRAARPSAQPGAAAPAKASSGGPLVAVVSIGQQRITVYGENGVVTGAPISSGKPGKETPQGVFSIIEKNVEHFSNIYDGAPMPFMQRITWSGIALHAGHLPGRPASSGCIRMPHAFARQLYAMTARGTRVVVTDGSPVPAPISHPALFTPRPLSTDLLASLRTPAAAPPASGTINASSGPASAAVRLAVPAAAVVTGSASGTAEMDAAAGVPQLTLEAQRAEVQQRLAELTRAEAEARATHTQTLREHRETLARTADAEADLKDAEAKLNLAIRARERARNERVAIRAEQAEEDALAAIERAQAIIAAASDEELAAAKAAIARTAAELKATEEARTEAQRIARDIDRRARPISVFISRKTQRLYVRQGFEPVLDVPVTIRDPHLFIGTHVFTAMDVQGVDKPVKWSALTVIGGRAELPVETGRRGRGEQAVKRPQPLATTAFAALDRIEIPDDIRQRVSEGLREGSSLIISDEGVSRETGKGTEFVILTDD